MQLFVLAAVVISLDACALNFMIMDDSKLDFAEEIPGSDEVNKYYVFRKKVNLNLCQLHYS